jgi:hypothetical protein
MSVRDQRTDYRLRRRAALRAVEDGQRSREDVCDAHPDLVRAGTHIGILTDEPCPICAEPGMRFVDYAYPRLSNGRRLGGAVRRDDLTRRAARYGELDVFEVEVCINCHWHHLVTSYVLAPDASASNGM